jgi:hypothetical protein
MHNVQVSDNTARADGPTGIAQGAGIWNGIDLSGPPVELTLQDSSVTGNVLVAHDGIVRQGGGLFTNTPVTLTNTNITLNRPDQCVGCSLTGLAHTARRQARRQSGGAIRLGGRRRSLVSLHQRRSRGQRRAP